MTIQEAIRTWLEKRERIICKIFNTEIYFKLLNDYSNSTGDYYFFYNHQQYSDMCVKEAMFLDEAINDLKKAWKAWK